MDGRYRWKLAKRLNVFQISLLAVGYDPGLFEGHSVSIWHKDVRAQIAPFLTALKNAATSGEIDYQRIESEQGYETNWTESTLDVDSVRSWFRSRNFFDGFFVSAGTEREEDMLDPHNSYYAPKLAAAVKAWRAVTGDSTALKGKTPKKALEIWLRKHANEYGLAGKDGNPNTLGIEEVCKVANWKPQGGASRTADPGDVQAAHPSSEEGGREAEDPPTPAPLFEADDEIPF